MSTGRLYYGVDLYAADGSLVWGHGGSHASRVAAVADAVAIYRANYPRAPLPARARVAFGGRHRPNFYQFRAGRWRVEP